MGAIAFIKGFFRRGDEQLRVRPESDTVNLPQVIDETHPAYGCGQAWFQFAFAADGAVRRLVLVEAKNPQAVMALESVLLRDGAVSDACRVVAVFRQCPSIGLRSDLVDEVPYVDFMLDVVDPARLLADPTVATMFRTSLSEQEREYASAKCGSMADEADEAAVRAATGSDGPAFAGVEPEPDEEEAARLTSALVGLGFDKKRVHKHVQSLGARVGSEPLPELIRESLQALAA